jgi:quercetin dioxygenase-like cupin family protein
MPRRFIARALPAPFEGWEAEFALVTMAPGPGYAPHRHPGFVLGYVIDGQFRFGLEGEAERVLNAGEVFYEPPGAIHTITASASSTRSARILAIIISKPAGAAKQ